MKLCFARVACLVAWASACASATPSAPDSQQEVSLRTTFQLHPGESARFAGESLTVSFEGVTEDSRCPSDTTCVWAGDAVVRTRLERDKGANARVDLHTNGQFPREGPFQDVRIRLERLDPARRDSTAIREGDYSATLIVDRN